MKKGLILLLFCLNSNFCIAAERIDIQCGSDYLITTDKSVKNIFVSEPDVLKISPFFTILNEKNLFLMHPTKQGRSNIMILFDKETATFEIKVEPKSKQIPQVIKKGYFEILPLDAPPKPEEFELDAPPLKIKTDEAK